MRSLFLMLFLLIVLWPQNAAASANYTCEGLDPPDYKNKTEETLCNYYIQWKSHQPHPEMDFYIFMSALSNFPEYDPLREYAYNQIDFKTAEYTDIFLTAGYLAKIYRTENSALHDKVKAYDFFIIENMNTLNLYITLDNKKSCKSDIESLSSMYSNDKNRSYYINKLSEFCSLNTASLIEKASFYRDRKESSWDALIAQGLYKIAFRYNQTIVNESLWRLRSKALGEAKKLEKLHKNWF